MNIKNYFFIILLFLIASIKSNAQQEILYTQYVYNQLIINPAYAGYHEALNISLNSRKQWLGLEGSPISTTLAGHAIIGGNEEYGTISKRSRRISSSSNQSKTGVGFLIFNDQIGVDNTLQANISYSYKIHFDEKRLSFGLQGSVLNYTRNFIDLENYNPEDPAFEENTRKTMINFGAGVFFDSDRYFVGFSVPQLVENYLDDTHDEDYRQLRQYFLTGGYLFYMNENYAFKPSAMLRYTEKIPFQLDINGTVIYQDRIFLGLSYRNKNTLSTIFQASFRQKLRVGLAYDYSFGEFKKASNGTVEVLLNYSFNNKLHKVLNPRYF